MADDVQLVVDDREQRSGVIDYLRKFEVPFVVKRLDVGDYVFEGHSVCIERKEAQDFIASIINGRLNNQLYQMSTNYELSYVVIEGDIWKELTTHNRINFVQNKKMIKRELILSYLASLVLKRSPDGKQGVISVLPSFQRDSDVAYFIKSLYQKLSDEDIVRMPKLQKLSFSTIERAIAALSCIEGVGEKTAQSLLEHFGNIKGVLNADFNDLLEVKGIGKKTAKKIIEFAGGNNHDNHVS